MKVVEGKITRTNREIVESKGIAFDHAKIIEYGIDRLRSKIEYTDISFNLMPELFTMTELQQVYEVILDTELLKANFRRKVADMVIETNEYTLKTWFNKQNKEVRVIVPLSTVDTYDLGLHDGDLVNVKALYNMIINGIEVVQTIEF